MENKMVMKEYASILEVLFYGDIDHQTTLHYRDRLVSKIQANKYDEVILNFKEVTFIDSSGIGMVLGRYNQLQQYGGKLYLACLPENTKKIFELSGILKLIQVKEVIHHG